MVTGQVVVLNGDASLVDGARIERALTVIGGTFESPERPTVGGEIRVWSAAYRYHAVGDTLVADLDFFSRWSRWMRDDERNTRGRTTSDLQVTTAHTYNRVEGLPIYVGPRVSRRSGDTRVRAELFGIFRTGDERWSSRRARNVLSIVNDDVPWRVNPLADEGVVKLLTVSGTFDTRNSPNDDARAGWYLRGEYEHGNGRLVRAGVPFVGAADEQPTTVYSRALFDLRRYNRLGPNGSLNMRAVVGGWINGDPLPAQRRFSVSGIDALPPMSAPAPWATNRPTPHVVVHRSAIAWRCCSSSGRETSA